MEVELITDRHQFAGMKRVWNEVLERSGVDHPFVTHEWISAWWDSFDPKGTPYILAVKDGGAITALAPLMLDRGKMYGCPIRRLHGMGNVYSERFELLLGDRPQEAAEALWNYLKTHAHRWDVLELRQIPVDSPTLTWISRLATQDGCKIGLWPSSESPYVAVRGEWDAYYKKRKKVHRADMRKRLASLEAQGPVEMEIVQSDADLDRNFEDALRLESSVWKGTQGTAIGSRPDSKSFYRDVIRMSVTNGWLRLYFLTVAGKRIAVRIALLFRNRVYMLKSGYDPQYAAFAPGHVLSHKILDEAWRLKFDEVDFLGNAERWKLDWSTDLHRHAWLFVFPRRLKPRLLHYLKERIIPLVRSSRFYSVLRRLAVKMNVEIHRE